MNKTETSKIALLEKLDKVVKSIYRVDIIKKNASTSDILLYLREMGLNAFLHAANFLTSGKEGDIKCEAERAIKLLDDIRKYLAFIHSSRLSDCKGLIKKINNVLSAINAYYRPGKSGENYGNV
jgi:hypothetical protein